MNESLSNDELELNPTDHTAEEEVQKADGDLKLVAEEVQRLTKERDQINEQLLRNMAEFQNFKRRNQQEQTLFRQYATENLVMSLLPVLDNFERTVQAADRGATMESVVAGVKAVEKQLRFLIEQQNVSRVPSLGQPFDANIHEALGTVPSEDYEPDTVVDEIEPGYKMGERVIRPAKVRVSVKP